MKRSLLVQCLAASVMGLALVALLKTTVLADAPKPKEQPDPAALKRARKTVSMLDDIYKQTIVLITDKYVKDEHSYAAGRAAVILFKNISEKGTHQVRLLDASGEPSNPNNIARNTFETEGIKKLKEGKSYYDEVIQKEGKPYLRAITPIPVVSPKCILCHSNYAKAKKGEPIGAISYVVPIE